MKIKTLEGDFTVCRLRSVGDIDPTCDFYFLGKNGIALFAVSTYNTDYILVKKDDYKKAMSALSAAGYSAA